MMSTVDGEKHTKQNYAPPVIKKPVELAWPAEVLTHLESLEDHAKVHSQQDYTGRPE